MEIHENQRKSLGFAGNPTKTHQTETCCFTNPMLCYVNSKSHNFAKSSDFAWKYTEILRFRMGIHAKSTEIATIRRKSDKKPLP